MLALMTLFMAHSAISMRGFRASRLSVIPLRGASMHSGAGAPSSSWNWIRDKPLISSGSNPKCALIKSLHESKGRRESGLILLEGHRLILEALQSGVVPRHVLISNSLAEGLDSPKQSVEFLKLCSLLKSANQNDNPGFSIDLVTDAVLRSISATENSQGVLLAAIRPGATYREEYLTAVLQNRRGLLHASSDSKQESSSSVTPSQPLILLLDGVQDPGNVGTLLRSAWGFGVDAVVVVDGCDIWNPKVIRSSMGTALRLPVLEMKREGAERWLRSLTGPGTAPTVTAVLAVGEHARHSGGTGHSSLSSPPPPPISTQLWEQDLTGPVILVVGSEARGVILPFTDISRGNIDPSGPGRGGGGGGGGQVEKNRGGAGRGGVRGEEEERGKLYLRVCKVHIPMQREMESLNAAVAGAVLLSETNRQRSSVPPISNTKTTTSPVQTRR